MLDQKRLDGLVFQAAHMGYSKMSIESLEKQGKKIDPKMGTMIALSPTEVQQFLGWREMALKLQKFKDYTHERLDAMGVPKSNPDNEHEKAGCRIGGRLDFVENKLSKEEA